MNRNQGCNISMSLNIYCYMKSFLGVVILGLSFHSFSQSTFDRYLGPVKEGKVINPESWLIDLNGDTTSYTEAFKGSWLLIDYWSTGCRPCIANFPHIEAFGSEQPENLKIIYVNLDATIPRWKKGNKRYKLSLPSYFGGLDNDNHFRSLNFIQVDDQLMVSFPLYVLIDPSGKIVSKKLPKPSSEEFKREIAILMGE